MRNAQQKQTRNGSISLALDIVPYHPSQARKRPEYALNHHLYNKLFWVCLKEGTASLRAPCIVLLFFIEPHLLNTSKRPAVRVKRRLPGQSLPLHEAWTVFAHLAHRNSHSLAAPPAAPAGLIGHYLSPKSPSLP